LRYEAHNLKFENIDQSMPIYEKKDETKSFKEILKKCDTATDQKIVNVCNSIKNDLMWMK
jgi:hypothetical protein